MKAVSSDPGALPKRARPSTELSGFRCTPPAPGLGTTKTFSHDRNRKMPILLVPKVESSSVMFKSHLRLNLRVGVIHDTRSQVRRIFLSALLQRKDEDHRGYYYGLLQSSSKLGEARVQLLEELEVRDAEPSALSDSMMSSSKARADASRSSPQCDAIH